jgi:hypothetical protein
VQQGPAAAVGAVQPATLVARSSAVGGGTVATGAVAAQQAVVAPCVSCEVVHCVRVRIPTNAALELKLWSAATPDQSDVLHGSVGLVHGLAASSCLFVCC